MMLYLLGWLLFGFVVGSIAEAIWPPKKKGSKWATVAVGVSGSVAGGLVGSIISGSAYQPAGIVMSVVGAIGCAWVYKHYIKGA